MKECIVFLYFFHILLLLMYKYENKIKTKNILGVYFLNNRLN